MLFFICLAPLTALAQDQVEVRGDGLLVQSQINFCETKTYNIRFLNNLGSTTSGFTITAKLAALTNFSYETGTAHILVNDVEICTVDPTPSGSDLAWDIDAACPGATTLDDGDHLDVSFDLTAGCGAESGTLNTQVDYILNSAPVSDPTGVHSIEVTPGAVTITKTPSVIPKYFGEAVMWTITVKNTGLGTIQNVEVTDTLGDGLLFDNASQSGSNAGQVTTWTSNEYAALASMNPNDVLTMTITAFVNGCTDLENVAEVRFGCNPSPADTCFDTASDGGTATAAVQFLPRSPKLVLTPEDITIGFCESGSTVTLN
ncbi:MAG: DUF11 domain-containing protein, partial [bacterium]|nr:DUF11 domain-containing protein [bacterium]